MKTQKTCALIAGYSMILCLQAVDGAEIPRLFNNTPLNQPGAWSGGVVPGPTDVALWNDLFVSTVTTVAALPELGSDLSFGGIKVTNVGGARNGVAYIGFKDVAPTKTLTIGADGVDMSTATQTFVGYAKVMIGADQTWNIADANTAANPTGLGNNEDFALWSPGANVPFNLGGKTVTTTGNGYVTLTSGYTVQNGTLNVGNNLFVIQGGSSRVTTVNSDVNLVVSAGRLRLQSNSGAGGISLTSNAPVTVNGGAFELRVNNPTMALSQSGAITLNQGSRFVLISDSTGLHSVSGPIVVNGDTTFRCIRSSTKPEATVASSDIQGSLSGAGDIIYQNEHTNLGGQWIFSGDDSGYTGKISINAASGNRSLRLASATAGSAAATWQVSNDNILQVHGVTVQLGTLTGNGTVTNSSSVAPATLEIGAGTFGGIISDGTQPTNVTKIGPGTLVLSGANSYSGLTTVSEGQLIVPTTQFANDPADFTVANNATLTVAQLEPDITLLMDQLTLGTSGSSTLEVAFGSNVNPAFAPLYATNLLVNGATTLRVSGTNLSVGTFPLIRYDTVGGSSGLAGFTLKLPPRTTGSTSTAGGVLKVTIDQTSQIKWVGNVSTDWDLAPGGTLNWKTTVGNTATRYIQGPDGSDIVNFDDSATGSGMVNLTTALTPAEIKVNNTSKNYTFTGSGHLTGPGALTKSGTGMLTLANTTANDYTGGTTIEAGTLRLGDGTTVGGGIITGTIANEGTLVLNRPDDHDFIGNLSGEGVLEKTGTNTVTIGIVTLTNSIVLDDGRLKFNGGGNLSGVISGTGEFEVAAGNLIIDGIEENTYTGETLVTGGSLLLNKPSNVQAVGGDITVTGAGFVSMTTDEQIDDNATLNVFGSSGNAISTGKETFARANLNGTTPEAQLILRNNSVITDVATVTQGILGIASANTATINRIVMTSPTAKVRIAGSGGPSVLNVGPGGIQAATGEIQVKFNTLDQDATLNLGGDLTTTGDFHVSNANYTGASVNVINLTGNRTFDIAANTQATFDPDFGDVGSLTKAGGGTMILSSFSKANHAGGTIVNAGRFLVNGSLSGTTAVSAGSTLGGSGTLLGATQIAGTVAPGVNTGTLTIIAPVTLAAGSSFAFDIANWSGTTAGTDWDLLIADTLTLAATAGNRLTIRIAGSPTGFTEANKTMAIATSVNPIVGFDASAIAIDATGFAGAGTFSVQKTGNAIELVYTAGAGSPYTTWAAANGLDGSNNGPELDPDNDGMANFVEFAFNGNPLSGATSGKSATKVATVGADRVLTLTIPVRSEGPFSGAPAKSLAVDGLVYQIEGSDNLTAWEKVVTEVTGADATAIQSGMPALDGGWFYRTFRAPGAVSASPRGFLRVRVEQPE